MDIFDTDKQGFKRAQLGDKSCEVLLAIRKRNKDFSNTGQQQMHLRPNYAAPQPQLQYNPVMAQP
jgi:hypothetical protein